MLGSVSKFTASQVAGTLQWFKTQPVWGCCLMRGYSCMERVRLSDCVIIFISHECTDRALCFTCYLGSVEWNGTQILVQWSAVSETLAGNRRTQLDPETRATNTCALVPSICCTPVSLSCFSKRRIWYYQGKMSKAQSYNISASYSHLISPSLTVQVEHLQIQLRLYRLGFFW